MDKKILVKHLIPIIQSLQADGLRITRAEIFPAEWRGYYTLAISADWADMPRLDRHKKMSKKMRELLPVEVYKRLLSVFTYNTPEEIEAEMEFLTQYQTPVGETLFRA
jgi:hypothetical protein